jgi:hypothetical protein
MLSTISTPVQLDLKLLHRVKDFQAFCELRLHYSIIPNAIAYAIEIA